MEGLYYLFGCVSGVALTMVGVIILAIYIDKLKKK